MPKRTILVFLMVLCSMLSVDFATKIHEPTLPKPISLPLGEINSRLMLPYTTDKSRLVEKTLESLPDNAWCQQQTTPILYNVSIRCYWPDVATQETLISDITIELPREGDTIYWKFDRGALQVVPMSHSWLLVNFGFILGAIAFAALALLSASLLYLLHKQS